MMSDFSIKIDGKEYAVVSVDDRDFVYTVTGAGKDEVSSYLDKEHRFIEGGKAVESGEEILIGSAKDNPAFLQRLLIRLRSELSRMGTVQVDGDWDIFTENIKEKEIKKSLKDLSNLIE